jgi:hypothetical protein
MVQFYHSNAMVLFNLGHVRRTYGLQGSIFMYINQLRLFDPAVGTDGLRLCLNPDYRLIPFAFVHSQSYLDLGVSSERRPRTQACLANAGNL